MKMTINALRKGASVFISVATGSITNAPWVLGFPFGQIDEVIEKLTKLKESSNEG